MRVTAKGTGFPWTDRDSCSGLSGDTWDNMGRGGEGLSHALPGKELWWHLADPARLESHSRALIPVQGTGQKPGCPTASPPAPTFVPIISLWGGQLPADKYLHHPAPTLPPEHGGSAGVAPGWDSWVGGRGDSRR